MRIFAATSRYIQGPGLIDQIGQHVVELGRRAVVITDADVQRLFGQRIAASFAAHGAEASILVFPGEVTLASIAQLTEKARGFAADIVVGVGGGKSIDTAKGVSRLLQTRFVSVPTIASNDGPASASVAVYDEHHVMAEIQQLKRNPDLVLVDSQAIVGAPVRFLRAGIGDAISKKFEAEACLAANAATLFGGEPSRIGMVVADACYQVIREHGAAALRDAAQRKLTAEVESVIEAAVLLSTLAFENGGLSIAHAIARGFPALQRAAGTLHGMHVAYGLLVQLVLEQREPAFIDDVAACFAELGLPLKLADFGLSDPSQAEIRQLAEGSMVSPSVRRFARALTAEDLVAAIGQVERRAAGKN